MARKKGHWQSERCTVCSHPKIGIINFALARGISPLAVANEHGLGTSAMYNHNRAHVEDNYRKIIGSGVYADIDELLKKCTQGDAESLDVLNAMISGFFHNWSLAFANCKRNIEMTPLCKIEVTLPRVLGSRGVHRGRVVDEQAGVQPSRRSAACSVG
jgi:hypothetical protein